MGSFCTETKHRDPASTTRLFWDHSRVPFSLRSNAKTTKVDITGTLHIHSSISMAACIIDFLLFGSYFRVDIFIAKAA